MHKIAIIENGIVTNIALFQEIPQGGVIADSCSIGDLWDGETFTTPEVIDPPTPIPQSVTRRQARSALLLAGVLGNVQSAIDGIADPIQRGLAQIEWDDSQAFERNRPLLISLGTALGLDSAALDQLFITAAGL